MVLSFGSSCAFILLALSATSAVVVVEDGGYQNVLVTFSPDINKTDQRRVLLETQTLMTRASSVIHKATGIHFGQVVLLLPYTWGNLENWRAEGATYSSANEIYHNANIFVENSANTVYGARPIALQSGGCGSEGRRISLPKDFLNLNEENGNAKMKHLAREWIRYRYGVFYENGYPNDDRYPLYYRLPGYDDTTNIRITDCTDKPVKYSFKDPNGEVCTLKVDNSGRPDKNSRCSFYPEIGNNTDVESSLMYTEDLPNVVYLCGDDDDHHVHNADTPNKQNSLCKGRSMWSVMKNHPDFKDRETLNKNGSFPEPKFKIVLDRNPRIVVAVDSTFSIGMYTKRIIGKALQKFLLDLPDESEFALLRFDSTDEVTTNIPFDLLKKRSLETLVYSNDGPPSPNHAVVKGLQDLTDANSNSKGTIVILSSADATTDDNSDLVNKLKSLQICLNVVVLNGSSTTNAGFRELSNAAPCSRIWNMPAPTDAKMALDVLTELNEEFGSVIRRHTYHNEKYTVTTTRMENISPISFKTDRSIKDFQILLATANLQTLGTSVEDRNIVLQNTDDQDFELNRIKEISEVWACQVFTNKSGQWSFSIKKYDSEANPFPILLQVVAKESSSESVRVQSWIEDAARDGGLENGEQMPVILHVEVTRGIINPVMDAKVEASVITPDGNVFQLDLRDNGVGDPDITKHDGIYSRYFTQFTSEGDYHVTFTISDNEGLSRTAKAPESVNSIPCCGSFVPTGVKQETGPFKRVIYSNFRARSGRPPNGYKPLRVQDLRLISWDDFGKQTMTWTAPGNEMDNGSAGKYIFKLFTTKDDAEKNFEQGGDITDGFTILQPVIPMDYQTEQRVEIMLNESITTNKAYFFAMRSESTGGRQSDTSNVIEIFIPAAVSSPTPTNDAISTREDDGSHPKTNKADGKLIGIIVGVCFLVIVIVICAYIAFYIFVVRRKRKQNEDEREDERSTPPSQQKSKDTTDTIPSSERMENSTISPVNFWPSNVLVNHHKQVKEAKRKNEKPPVFRIENLESTPDVISTISNGLLPNPVYSSVGDDLDESYSHEDHEMHVPQQELQNQVPAKPNRRVTHV